MRRGPLTHPAGVGALFSLLVPVVSMNTSWLVLEEQDAVIEPASC
ncbi:hypothetical protein ACOQFL_16205 [Actinopolyspora sp. H202]